MANASYIGVPGDVVHYMLLMLTAREDCHLEVNRSYVYVKFRTIQQRPDRLDMCEHNSLPQLYCTTHGCQDRTRPLESTPSH